MNHPLAQVGIDRSQVYVTNAVKRVKYEQRGKRRIHQKPSSGEVTHVRWQLMRELSFVRLRLVAALGASADLALGQSGFGDEGARRGPLR